MVSCSSSARSRHWHSLILNSFFRSFLSGHQTSIHRRNNFDLITQCLHSSHLNFILYLCLGHGTFSTNQVNSKYKMALANIYKRKSTSIAFFCSYQFKPLQRSQKSRTQKSQIIQPQIVQVPCPQDKYLAVKSREHASSCSWYHHLPTRAFEGNWSNSTIGFFIKIRCTYNQITSIHDPFQIFITNICLYHLIFSCFFLLEKCQKIILLQETNSH